MSEKSQTKTTIFAVRTTIGRERTVQDLIFNRLRTINPLPDLKAILTAELYRGYVFVEAVHQRDVVHITNGLPHVKGKVVGSIPFTSVEKVIKPEKAITYMGEGDIVEITSGVFQNIKAQIVNMSKESSKEEVTVRLLDSDSPIKVKIHADFLKLVEKAKPVTTEYIMSSSEESKEKEEEKPIASETQAETVSAEAGKESGESEKEAEKEPTKVLYTEEEVGTSMDDTFSFEEDLDDSNIDDDFITEDFAEESDSEGDEDEEDEDDWAKFF
ncbi:MAG: transcription elongation factor Spt5 [Candidatus Lokiarchaeota archaeon]|nr:transcription elongation factor Spt5 [Candidatus Lokiarchaeota archaeon]